MGFLNFPPFLSSLKRLCRSFVSNLVCFESSCRNYSQSVAAAWLFTALSLSALVPLCCLAPRVPAVWVFPSASCLIGGGRVPGLSCSSSEQSGSPGCCLEAGQWDRRLQANHQQEFVLAAHWCVSEEIHPRTQLASALVPDSVRWPQRPQRPRIPLGVRF